MTPEEIDEQIAELQDRVDAMKAVCDNPPTEDDVVFPHIHVRLVGEDGNAFFILGRVNKAMKEAGVDPVLRKTFHDQATSGDYNHLLRTVMEWVVTY